MKPRRKKRTTFGPGTLHPQVRIAHGERAADVDKALAPLILELWRAGLDTVMSCQRHMTGRVWIQFDSADAAETFLNIVAPYDPGLNSLYDRAGSWYFGSMHEVSGPLSLLALEQLRGLTPDEREAVWQYHATVRDLAPDDAAERCFAIYVSVLFPRSDLKTVLRRMRTHNAPK